MRTLGSLTLCRSLLRAGLVDRAKDWPYQSEIVLIDRAYL